jgi:hypothetical protein
MPKVEEVNKSEIKRYVIADIDLIGDDGYCGYIDKDGEWYIKQITNTSVRYVKGKDNYISNWENRLLLEYKYPHEIFHN